MSLWVGKGESLATAMQQLRFLTVESGAQNDIRKRSRSLRLAQVVALRAIATKLSNQVELLLIFDTFGDHISSDAARNADNRLNNVLAVGVGHDIGDECSINLDFADWEIPKFQKR